MSRGKLPKEILMKIDSQLPEVISLQKRSLENSPDFLFVRGFAFINISN